MQQKSWRQPEALTALYVVVSPSIPLCALINQHLSVLARKFPQTKFLKSISTTCIPNYPDHNLPTIFVYFEGEMKAQFIGPLVFGGMNLKVEGRTRKKQDILNPRGPQCLHSNAALSRSIFVNF